MRLLAFLLLLIPALASAQTEDRRPSHCIALVENTPDLAVLTPANFRAPLEDNTVRLTYVDHSMVLIQTAGGLSAVTDFAGWIGNVEFTPDVVTMNNAHSTHWTPFPDPAIPHVLEGWRQEGAPADHHLDLGEMLVRNVTTDIRSRGMDGIDGNSIFVFEVAGLCIGHLGHLHHEPTPEQYAAIGRLDIVLAAVDGGLTVDLPTMIRILQRFRSSVVIPIHWFGRSTLELFLDGMSKDFAIERPGTAGMEISLRTLPNRPTVVVLEPRFLGLD